MVLTFAAEGQGAVFHVYDRHALADVPRRYVVAAGHRLDGLWPFDRDGGYDLWTLGPNGFHRHFVGHRDDRPVDLSWTIDPSSVSLHVGPIEDTGAITVTRLLPGGGSISQPLVSGVTRWSTQTTLGWHDVTIADGKSAYRRRIAGRCDQPHRDSISDPFLPSA
jgi:phospholipase C